MPPRVVSEGGFLPAELPLTFRVDGKACVLPHQPTRDLVDVYASGNPLRLVPGACDPDTSRWLVTRLDDQDDDYDLDDLEAAALGVGTSLAGVDYWPAVRLLESARRAWMLFDGWCLQQGFSPLHEPVSRVVAASYAWRLSMCSKDQEAKKLDQQVFAPVTVSLSGRSTASRAAAGWDEQTEADAFASALARFGGS